MCLFNEEKGEWLDKEEREGGKEGEKGRCYVRNKYVCNELDLKMRF